MLSTTRFSAETGIKIRQFDAGHWQHVDCNEARNAQVGPVYKTKAELLADHEDYLRRAGWLRS
jgi:hypothetical protein